MLTLGPILSLVAGLVLLFAGRRFFWLAAGLTAFIFIYNRLLNALGNSLFALVIAAIVGLILAGLAIKFIKFGGGLIGALAGAAGFPLIMQLFGVPGSNVLFALIGAALGVMLVLLAFDIGLVLVTAWVGASAILDSASQVLTKGSTISMVIFIVLLLAGIGVQLNRSVRLAK